MINQTTGKCLQFECYSFSPYCAIECLRFYHSKVVLAIRFCCGADLRETYLSPFLTSLLHRQLSLCGLNYLWTLENYEKSTFIQREVLYLTCYTAALAALVRTCEVVYFARACLTLIFDKANYWSSFIEQEIRHALGSSSSGCLGNVYKPILFWFRRFGMAI